MNNITVAISRGCETAPSTLQSVVARSCMCKSCERLCHIVISREERIHHDYSCGIAYQPRWMREVTHR